MAKASIVIVFLAIVLGAFGVFYFSNFIGPFFEPNLSENKTYTTQSAVDAALDTLNTIRGGNGLLPLSLASDASTAYRANDMLANQYFGHYDLSGYAPSYYYTSMGGQYAMEENIACYYSSFKLGYNTLMNFANESIYQMVYNDSSSNWGHRDSLMDPTNNVVNISFSYDDHHAFLVIHMIKEWVQWDSTPIYAEGIFSCSGDFWPTLQNGFESVNVYYSNPADNLNHTYDNELKLTITGYAYDLGTIVAGVVPEPFHYDDIVTIRPLTWDINSGESRSHFSFSFEFQASEGAGLYTIMVFSKRPISTLDPYDPTRYLDSVPVLEYTIKIN